MYCKNCGKEIADDANQCNHCGAVNDKKTADTLKENIQNIVSEVNEEPKKWKDKSKEEKTNSVFDWIFGIFGLIGLVNYHSWISLAWNLKSNIFIFLLHGICFLMLVGSFALIPTDIIKIIYCAVKQKRGEIARNIFEVIAAIIVYIIAYNVFMAVGGEIFLLVILVLEGFIEKQFFDKNKKNTEKGN